MSTILNNELIQSLIVAVFVAAAAGLLGSFAILKRMALVGDALSHVALPGMAIALLLNLHPFLGAFIFLIAATIGIWLLETYSKLAVETLVGIFFSASLAIGVLITPNQDLIEALFGNIESLRPTDAVVSTIIALALMVFIWLMRKKLALNMISAELAQSVGIKHQVLSLIYLLIFALAVALGIRFVGALLMGSLVIIPAAAAKNVASSFNGFLLGSMLFGVIAAVVSVFIWRITQLTPGPIFILTSVGMFFLSLIIRIFKRRYE